MNVSRLGIAAVLTLLSAASLEAQGTRIGYMNTAEVMDLYQPARDALDLMEADGERWTLQLQQLRAQLQADVQQYQQQQMTMTPEARQIREQELTDQNTALQRTEDQITLQAQQRRDELLQPVMDKISTTIEEMRVELGYGMILDVVSEAILSADESLNLTPELLTRLEAKDAAEANR